MAFVAVADLDFSFSLHHGVSQSRERNNASRAEPEFWIDNIVLPVGDAIVFASAAGVFFGNAEIRFFCKAQMGFLVEEVAYRKR